MKTLLTSFLIMSLSLFSFSRCNNGELAPMDRVSTEVVKIERLEGRGGGTGFHIIAPSGQVYILTNAHVCAVAQDGLLKVTSEIRGGDGMVRSVLDESIYTDLCLIEALPDAKGLMLAQSFNYHDEAMAIGHPLLRPLTRTKGEISARETVQVQDHIIDYDDPMDTCSLPKNKKDIVDYFFFQVEMCFIVIDSISTTVPILPGNSGSPLVNENGDVIGIMFAANPANWGYAVAFDKIQEFLVGY